MSVKYINILKSIEIAEKRRKKRGKNHKWNFQSLILIAMFCSIAIAIAFAGKYYFAKQDWIKYTSLIFLLLAYLTFPAIQIYNIYRNRYNIKKSFSLPLGDALNLNVKTELYVDTMYFPSLQKLTKEALQLGLLEIKNERDYLEKRIILFIGPIDKLGILPGIVATIAALTKIQENHSWVSGIAYGYMGLTILSLFFYQLIMRYERMIALTELALESKSEASTS